MRELPGKCLVSQAQETVSSFRARLSESCRGVAAQARSVGVFNLLAVKSNGSEG